MRNAGLDEAEVGIKIAGRSINSLICRWYHPYGKKQRETEEPVDEGERGEWKNWYKTQHSKNYDHGIQPHQFMANKWRNNGNSDRLYFLGLQKQHRWWLQPWNSKTRAPWKKRYDKLSMLKNRDITWPTNIQIVRVMVFPVVMHGFDSWTIKKAECLRIDAFELWFWRRLLRVLWTTRRSNQSVLKEINPEYSLEGLMLRLKL